MTIENSAKNRSLGEKLLVAGGAASLALASGNPAETAVVSALNTPISPQGNAGTYIEWDVDGDSVGDFSLGNSSQFDETANLNEYGANRFVAQNGVGGKGFAKLSSGFEVGPVMSGFNVDGSANNFISVTYKGTQMGNDLSGAGWSFGDVAFFGFKFISSGNTYWGWGELDIHGGTIGKGFTITRAYYNNTAGASILVGDTGSAVPEPSTCALALLAAGGVAAYKGRRKQAAV